MKDSSSPEDKLLRLIRKPKRAPEIAPLKTDRFNSKAVSGRDVKSAPGKQLRKNKLGIYLNLQGILTGLFIACVIYLILSLIYPWVGLKNIRLPKLAKNSAGKTHISKDAAKSLEQYLESVKGRQIFIGGVATQGASPVSVGNIDALKDISLVGIISGENPQAVIEDKKTQKTYYVSKGQFIGEMQVEDIQSGKIIVNYSGQKYELYM